MIKFRLLIQNMYYYILVTENCAKISFQMLDLVSILLY